MLPRWVWCIPCCALAAAALAAAPGQFRPQPYDWPQWQGPDRSDRSRETGLLRSWPQDGPPLVWKAQNLGGGYSTPCVAAGRIFGMGWVDGNEVVWALGETDGKPLWLTAIARAKPASGSEGREGSRSTPTVDGDRLYALGQNGDLVCLATTTGKPHWHKNLVRDLDGRVPRWGYSESPLLDGDKLVVTPGGKAATLVALHKKTGTTVWKAQVPEGDGAAYSSVILANVDGQRQYVQMLSRGVVGVAAADGKFLWRFDQPANGVANCTTPLYHDHYVFACSGYGAGGALARLTRDGDEDTRVEKVYTTKDMKNQHGGVVLVAGYLYGSNDPSLVTCLRFDRTLKQMWSQRHPSKGSIAFADGRLYYRDENGPMYLIEANPRKYVERGRFNPPDRSQVKAWSHPVIANGKLYLRDQDVLLCYDVKRPE